MPEEPSSLLRVALIKSLARETRGLVGGLIGGSLGGLLAFLSINYFSRSTTIMANDAVAIANTYIVYTTVVIAAVALLLTVAGLILTQNLAVEKASYAAQAFDAVLGLVRSDGEKAAKLIQQMMENPAAIDYLNEALAKVIDDYVTLLKANANATLRDAVQHAEAVDSLPSGLSAGKNNRKD